jgi:hypothetical protein
MFGIAAATPRFSILPIGIALTCLIFIATSLSSAGRLSESLAAFLKRPVEIRVWGEALSKTSDEACEIESIRAVGAGLHLFVKYSTRPRGHLKVAQPRVSRIAETTVEIGDARYIQWEGRKLPRTTEAPAVTVTIRE